MAPPPPKPLTIGEVNSRLLAPRALMWAVAVYFPCMCMAVVAAIAYDIYSTESVYRVVVPTWWLPPLMLWGVYLVAIFELGTYMHLFLPHAPFAAREALVEVGICWVGFPLSWISVLVSCLEQRWMAIAWSCLMVVVIAGVVAFWVRLDRMYRGTSTTTGPPATGPARERDFI